MSYRRLGVVGKHYDDHVNLLKRQVVAAEYIKALRDGRHLINIDESIIRSTDQRNRGWTRYGKRILTSRALRLPQISMIAAITSQGFTFFSINQGKTTSLTFSFFLTGLCKALDARIIDWRTNSTLLLDNASIHRAKDSLQVYNEMGLPVMFLAPYSFKMAAVEKLFSFVKNRDLNPLVVKAYSR
jgi:DNA-binding Xre family transcriptional regulator